MIRKVQFFSSQILMRFFLFPEIVIAVFLIGFPNFSLTLLNRTVGEFGEINGVCRALVPMFAVSTISLIFSLIRKGALACAATKIGFFHFFIVGVAGILLIRYLSNPMVVDPYWMVDLYFIERLVEVLSCIGLGYVVGDVVYFVYFKIMGK